VVIYFTKIFLYIYLFIYSLLAWIWSGIKSLTPAE
jgi:hypothetical protein